MCVPPTVLCFQSCDFCADTPLSTENNVFQIAHSRAQIYHKYKYPPLKHQAQPTALDKFLIWTIHPDQTDLHNVSARNFYPKYDTSNMPKCGDESWHLYTLWPSDDIRRYTFVSTFAQVRACGLNAPSHYLNQRWLRISGFCGNFATSAQAITFKTVSWLHVYILLAYLTGANELLHAFQRFIYYII